MAIDFKFADTISNSCLASCYEKNGFTLQYSSKPSVKWGASSTTAVGDSTYRDIVVIRKKLGDPNLYVYASNKMDNAIIETVITNTLTTTNSAPLAFGANVQSDGFVDMYAKGTIYWAKLWNSDLGQTICRNLASWTRETITMQAAGNAEHTFRLFKRVDNDRYSNCVFLMKNLLDRTQKMNTEGTNSGGWAKTLMRTWLNARVYNGLPDQWKLLVQQVKVTSSIGSQSYDLSTSNDYIWLPSCKEVGFNTTTSPYAGESDATINYFTSDQSRIKKLNNGTGNANYWWLRSPNINYSTGFYIVGTSGTCIYYNGAYISIGVCFGFCI